MLLLKLRRHGSDAEVNNRLLLTDDDLPSACRSASYSGWKIFDVTELPGHLRSMNYEQIDALKGVGFEVYLGCR